MNAEIRIVCDSREQTPFTFAGYPVEVSVATLASSDYSLHGFSDRIGIERKSLADLVQCLSTERERFQRELVRLKGFDFAAVIVESSIADLRSGRFRSKLNPESAFQSVLAFSQRYRIPFWFCDSRNDAERVCYDILRHYHRDRVRELEALRIPSTLTLGRTGGKGAVQLGGTDENESYAHTAHTGEPA